MIYLLDRIKDIDRNIDYWQATRLNLKSDFIGGITDPLPFDFDNPTDDFIR